MNFVTYYFLKLINLLFNVNIIFLFILFILIIVVTILTKNSLYLLPEDLFFDLYDFFNLFKNYLKIILLPIFLILSNFILFYILIITLLFFIINLLKFFIFYFFRQSFFIYNAKNYNINWFSEELNSILILFSEIFIELPKMLSYNYIYNFCYFFIGKKKNKFDLNIFKKFVFVKIFKLLFFIPYKCITLTTKIVNIFYKNWFVEKLQKINLYNFISYCLLDIYVYYVNDLKYISEKKKIFFENNKIKLNGSKLSTTISQKNNYQIINELSKSTENYLNSGSFRNINIIFKNKNVNYAGIIFKKNEGELNLYSNTTTKATLKAFNCKNNLVEIHNGYSNTGTYNKNVKNENLTQIIVGSDNLKSSPLDKQFVINFISNPSRIIQMKSNIVESLFKPALIEKNIDNGVILTQSDSSLLEFFKHDFLKKSDELKKMEESARCFNELILKLEIKYDQLNSLIFTQIIMRDYDALSNSYDFIKFD